MWHAKCVGWPNGRTGRPLVLKPDRSWSATGQPIEMEAKLKNFILKILVGSALGMLAFGTIPAIADSGDDHDSSSETSTPTTSTVTPTTKDGGGDGHGDHDH